ncbi:MAG: BREX system Lon protease-like protein BrxL [Firmicutes bacterium]|nr:BREX system Lon protease-like protein BrxL [Bacillota bacterium]
MDNTVIKLREHFADMVVYKDLSQSNFFKALSIPSFLRDWIVKRFQNDEGYFDEEAKKAATEFISAHLPKPKEFKKIVNRIVNDFQQVKLLTRITTNISIHTGEITFNLPDYALLDKETKITQHMWDDYKDDLLGVEDIWGIVELGYLPGDETQKGEAKKGKITLKSFKKFQPYTIDLNEFKNARRHFTTEEWINVLLGAIDYNPEGYDEKIHKTTMLSRLLPFVEKRVNLIELAPKGTGKSYVFGNIGKYGSIVGGGTISRARVFYNKSKEEPGIIFYNDFVAFDEIQTLTLHDAKDLASAFKTYMEFGEYQGDAFQGSSDCGIVFLGNILKDRMNEYDPTMLHELPSLFKESAFLDRLHGFIKGWDIPRMNDSLAMKGFGLNSEYFTSILNMLRDDASYRLIVEGVLDIPKKADRRDSEAIIRIATAFTKLLMPHIREVSDIDLEEFNTYCLGPAIEMRAIIKYHMGLIDPKEYGGKDVPDIKVKQ